MKQFLLAVLLGLVARGVSAQDSIGGGSNQGCCATVLAPSATTAPAVDPKLPEGVTVELNELKQAFMAKASSKPALFRRSDNMPEIVNENLLRSMAETGKKEPGTSDQFIGYMPKLKVLPCAKGCEGRAYERAVEELIEGYRGDAKHFKERGELIVQVRWFNVRPFLMTQLPYSADLFGISFMLEGKVVSLGKNSGVGVSVKARELARDIGARLAMELAYTLGMGVKPTFLLPGVTPGENFSGKVMKTGAVIDGMLGVEDTRSRIEPATDAHSVLMPAIDGIKPGELEPIDRMYYLNSLLF